MWLLWICEYFTTFVSVGVLRLGPVGRQQSSVLHDAQQELSDELVKLLQTEHCGAVSPVCILYERTVHWHWSKKRKNIQTRGLSLETRTCFCRESTGSLYTAHKDAVSEITCSGTWSPAGGADALKLCFRPYLWPLMKPEIRSISISPLYLPAHVFLLHLIDSFFSGFSEF